MFCFYPLFLSFVSISRHLELQRNFVHSVALLFHWARSVFTSRLQNQETKLTGMYHLIHIQFSIFFLFTQGRIQNSSSAGSGVVAPKKCFWITPFKLWQMQGEALFEDLHNVFGQFSGIMS